MTSAKEFCVNILNSLALFPEEKSDDLIVEIESQYTQRELQTILIDLATALPDNRAITTKDLAPLQDFFAKRWQRIQNTNLSYFYGISNNTNLACLVVSQYLEEIYHISRYHILMPSIQIAHYDITSTNLMDKTLELQNFIMNDDNTVPIEVADTLGFAVNDGILKHTCLFDGKIKRLSQNEAARVINHSEESKAYWDAIQQKIQVEKKGESFGAALTRLKDGLLAGGEHGGEGGDEFNAVYNANVAITFFNEFLKTLKQQERNKLLQCTANGLTVGSDDEKRPATLGDIWDHLARPVETYSLKAMHQEEKFSKNVIFVENENGKLKYVAVNAINEIRVGKISPYELPELKEKLKNPLDILLLKPLLPQILKLTAKRGHTHGAYKQQRYCVELLAGNIEQILQQNPKLFNLFPGNLEKAKQVNIEQVRALIEQKHERLKKAMRLPNYTIKTNYGPDGAKRFFNQVLSYPDIHKYLTTAQIDSIRRLLIAGLRNKSPQIVQTILKMNKVIDNVLTSYDESGLTPLHVAIGEDNKEIIEAYANKYINQQSRFGETLLFYAAKKGKTDSVTYLISKHAFIDKPNHDNTTPLHVAAKLGHVEIVKKLLAARANVNIPDIQTVSPLFAAITDRRYDIAQQLINAKANINLATSYGMTPLMMATKHGNSQLVQLLLTEGADVTLMNKNYESALIFAMQSDNVEIIKLLLNANADPAQDTPKKITPFLIAAEKNNITLLEAFLKLPIVCKHTPEERYRIIISLIFVITFHQCYEPIGNLFNNLATKDDKTLLVLEFPIGVDNIVNKFIKTYPDIHQGHGPEAKTLLHIAAENGYVDLTKILLLGGAKVDCVTQHNETPLFLAMTNNKPDIVSLLLKAQANVDYRNAANDTALLRAADIGNVAIAKLLIAAKADMQAINKNHQTPLLVAISKKHLDMIKVLLNANEELDQLLNVFPQQRQKFLDYLCNPDNIVRLQRMASHIEVIHWAKQELEEWIDQYRLALASPRNQAQSGWVKLFKFFGCCGVEEGKNTPPSLTHRRR